MLSFLIEAFWTPDGYLRNQRVIVNRAGIIRSVEDAAEPQQGDTILSGVTLPGFVNGHSHVHQRAIAGLTESKSAADDDFWTWRNKMYEAVKGFDADTFFENAVSTYRTILEQGYTTVVEFHYLHRLPQAPELSPLDICLLILEAAEVAGIRLTLLPVLYQKAGLFDEELDAVQQCFVLSTDAYVGLVDALIERLTNHTQAFCGVAFHSLRAVEAEVIRKVAERYPTLPKHIHISEQAAEVLAVERLSKETPIAYLGSKVKLDSTWTLVHATHITDAEVGLLYEEDVTVCLCPTTEANLGDGFAPTSLLIDEGVSFGIGSDSHVSIDPASELRLLEYVERLRLQKRILLGDGEHAPATLLIERCTEAGARMSGQPLGRLAAGMFFDVITLASHAHDDLISQYIFQVPGPQLESVWVGGSRVHSRGETK